MTRALVALAALTLLAGCSAAPQSPARRSLRMRKPRAAHTATLLDDGHVLLAGGCATARCRPATRTTEIFDGERFRAGPALPAPREGHTASPLVTGEVLLAGGYTRDGGRPLASAELVTAGRARPVGPMAAARSDIAGSVSRATGLDPVVAGDAPAIERYDVIAKRFATVAPSGAAGSPPPPRCGPPRRWSRAASPAGAAPAPRRR